MVLDDSLDLEGLHESRKTSLFHLGDSTLSELGNTGRTQSLEKHVSSVLNVL